MDKIDNLIELEKSRQINSINLIASENYVSDNVMKANGSVLTNKYSEGYPGARYYGGNRIIDIIEKGCQDLALKAFDLSNEWGVNVQPLSGSAANYAVYNGLLNFDDMILGLEMSSGGHLTHGYHLSSVSKFWKTSHYFVDNFTGLINYQELSEIAIRVKPKIIIAGASAYSREIDYKRMRDIADSVNAYLMSDISHISGLIASGVLTNNPFEYSHVVTSSTQKTLRGPRGGIIWFKKELEERINNSVFPGIQGGPHVNTIAALTVALTEVLTSEFKNYSLQIIKNSRYLSNYLIQEGFNIITGGTDNHLILVDLRKRGLNGEKVEKILDLCDININRNTIPGDTDIVNPSGIRLGTAALTSRGLVEKDMEVIGNLIIEGIKIAENNNIEDNNTEHILRLKEKVNNFINKFPIRK